MTKDRSGPAKSVMRFQSAAALRRILEAGHEFLDPKKRIFKPQSEIQELWAQSIIFRGDGQCYLFGRGEATVCNLSILRAWGECFELQGDGRAGIWISRDVQRELAQRLNPLGDADAITLTLMQMSDGDEEVSVKVEGGGTFMRFAHQAESRKPYQWYPDMVKQVDGKGVATVTFDSAGGLAKALRKHTTEAYKASSFTRRTAKAYVDILPGGVGEGLKKGRIALISWDGEERYASTKGKLTLPSEPFDLPKDVRPAEDGCSHQSIIDVAVLQQLLATFEKDDQIVIEMTDIDTSSRGEVHGGNWIVHNNEAGHIGIIATTLPGKDYFPDR